MEYKVEEESPVKKKIAISVSPEEAEAAIKGAVALYRQNAQLDGFRKGKAPATVIEKRFHDSIYKDAKQDLINVHINEVLQKLEAEPLGGIHITGDEKPLEKGKGYEYTLEFETLPTFDLPPYEGVEVEEEKIEPGADLVNHMLDRMRRERGKLVPASGNGPATDGQVANIDFETILDGKPIDNFKTTGFDLEIKEGAALPEFIDLIKTLPAGHTGEKVIHFPDNFISHELAGKDATMKATVHAIKEWQIPEADDKFAEQLGKKDLAELKDDLAKAYAAGMKNVQKSVTQQKLLDKLVKMTDFELPPSMIDLETNLIIGDIIGKAENEGRSVVKTPGDLDKLKEQARPDAERRAREKTLLLKIAKKENLTVDEGEVEKEIYKSALKMGMDPGQYFDKLRDSGLIFQLRDNLIADKAMDLVYDRAKVTEVEPARKEGEAQASGEGDSAAADSEAQASGEAKETNGEAQASGGGEARVAGGEAKDEIAEVKEAGGEEKPE